MEKMTHKCPDGTIWTWIPRVEHPKACPGCHNKIKYPKTDTPNKEPKS